MKKHDEIAEPAPAEQEKGLELARKIAGVVGNFIHIVRADNGQPCGYDYEVENAAQAISALLAARPRPEAKVVPMAAFADILAAPAIVRQVLAVVGYRIKE
jgi:hypothetical protein